MIYHAPFFISHQNVLWSYKMNQWTRVAHSHGQTILSLAFNYGILSLMTLSFGISALPIKVPRESFNNTFTSLSNLHICIFVDRPQFFLNL